MSALFVNLYRWPRLTMDLRKFLIMRSAVAITAFIFFLRDLTFSNQQNIFQMLGSVVLLVSIVFMFLGFYYRFAAFIVGICALTLHFGVPIFSIKMTYAYSFTKILGLSCLAISWIRGRNSSLKNVLDGKIRRQAFGCGIRVIQALVIIVYLTAIGTKLNFWYLSGGQLQQIFMNLYWGSYHLDELSSTILQVLAIAALLIEIIIVYGLVFTRKRSRFIYLGIGFHAILFVALPVYSFSILMSGLLCSFFESDVNDHSCRGC